jgi:uncharacterized OB-fold protein
MGLTACRQVGLLCSGALLHRPSAIRPHSKKWQREGEEEEVEGEGAVVTTTVVLPAAVQQQHLLLLIRTSYIVVEEVHPQYLSHVR